MTMTEHPDVASTVRPTFDVHNPGTGEVVGTYPIHSADEVAATVERARAAGQWWAGLSWRERAERLTKWNGIVARRADQLAGLMHDETGKPHSDARLEVSLVLDHVVWAAKHAPKVLGPRGVSPGLLMKNIAASVEYKPLGVVGVIGPWNYPVFTPMGSIVYALAAGNAVVFKPSEYSPGVGLWLVDAFRQVVPEHPVLQAITGLGETGAALCRSGVDKVAFTGSTATAKRVMAACAETLTPVVAECGGKDPVLVDADADLDAAADAALFSGMSNAGQTCIGAERVYVHEKVYDEFVQKLVDKAKTVRAGSDPEAKIGPITMPKQVDVIRRHIDDALARGGRALIGGRDSVDGQIVQPTVLVDVPEDSVAVTEETFGPTLTVAKVRDMDEAIERANATRYGLAASVFAKKNATDLADRLRCGMVAINSVLSFAAIPALPFGGVGDSGFGRIHGADGLREFSYSHAVARQRFKPLLALTTLSRTEKTDTLVAKIATLLYGRAK
jgi:acyl-CoA reductase-like NAD-dependent aldehyde dehydrogenase